MSVVKVVSVFSYERCCDCGISIPLGMGDEHVCEREQWISYQVDKASRELRNIDAELRHYLETPQGRFDLWYAQRSRSPSVQ
jgi:hypothetical protein